MSNAKKRAAARPGKPLPQAQTPATVISRDHVSLGLSLLGLVLSLYLLANHQTDGLPGCAAGGGCDRVQQSPWSVLWGIPVAGWGASAYLALAALCAWPNRRLGTTAMPVIATLGLAISLYLTAITWHELGAWCPWCLASLAIIGALCLRGWWRTEAVLRRWLGILSLVAAAGAVTVVHHAQGGGNRTASGLPPEVLQDLAEHLKSSGARFYGASWCGACAGQKAVFGAAAETLPYVECAPHGPGTAQSTDCLMAEIRTYPTWIIRGSKRPGALTPEQLAAFSGFALPAAERE